MPRLVVQTVEFEGQVFELTGPEVFLGRAAANQIVIEHGSVSGRHAVFTASQGGDYMVRDLNSTNGTRVNGSKVVQHPLQRGDTVHIGNIQLYYDSELGGDALPLPEPTQGIQLNPSNQSVRPAGFVNASPLGSRASGGDKDPLFVPTVALGIAGAGAFVFLILKLFVL